MDSRQGLYLWGGTASWLEHMEQQTAHSTAGRGWSPTTPFQGIFSMTQGLATWFLLLDTYSTLDNTSLGIEPLTRDFGKDIQHLDYSSCPRSCSWQGQKENGKSVVSESELHLMLTTS